MQALLPENSYPSGFAGGFVPDAMPESRGLGLGFQETASPTWSEDSLAVFRISDGAYADVSREVRAGAAATPSRYLVASRLLAKPSPWYGGRFYVDLLRPGVTERFLSLTMDAYKREIGGEFGARVPGVFTDEPELRPAGGLPWTDRLPDLFQQRWGYSLTANLPALRDPLGDWKKVRHDYAAVARRVECGRTRPVRVGVGGTYSVGTVCGGNGLRPDCGLRKITIKTQAMIMTPTSVRMVRISHKRPELLLGGGASLTSV